MRWADWRLFANRRERFADGFDYEGPSCYEFGTGGIRGGSIEPHYVGETKNERKRMCQCACYGSRLLEIIAWHLRQGWCLYCRGIALPT